MGAADLHAAFPDHAVEPLPEQPRFADHVYSQLRSAILEGRLAPGSRLSVPALATHLNVSRSPVREAVQRLVADGFASEEPRRGAAVAKLDPAELVPLYEVREVLEGLAASLAARHADGAELAALQATHARHAYAVEHGHDDEHTQLDMAFHAAIRAAARNDELQSSLEKVQGRIAIAIVGGRPRQWAHDALVEHAAILEAITARDAAAAEQAARAHIRRVRTDIAALDT